MVCLRTFRRHWICSIFVFSFFLLFYVFGLSHDSYATSATCELTGLLNSGYSGTSGFSNSTMSNCSSLYDSVDRSLTRYLSFDFIFNHIAYQSSPVRYFTLGNSISTSEVVFGYYNRNTSGLVSYSGTIVLPPYFTPDFMRYNLSSSYFLITQGKFTLSDESPFGSSSEPEPCPVCPEIPENPYDNKLDDIKKAIYACGAILIMLYFFFCIYKIIVKDGGSR